MNSLENQKKLLYTCAPNLALSESQELTLIVAISHPTQELTETGLPLGKISSNPDKEGRQISFADRGFTSKGWHSDVAFEPFPSLFTILKMVSFSHWTL